MITAHSQHPIPEVTGGQNRQLLSRHYHGNRDNQTVADVYESWIIDQDDFSVVTAVPLSFCLCNGIQIRFLKLSPSLFTLLNEIRGGL